MDSLLRLDFFFKIENQDRSFEQGIVTTAGLQDKVYLVVCISLILSLINIISWLT